MKKLLQYIKDSFDDIKKVTWPTKNQAVILSLIVFAVCIVVAIFLGVLDYVFGLGIQELINLAK
ncbi:MAG: preprotein translocase subunit SecE [Patescibacteria group bacterium]|nr:preprotein translocase subunit SecE [Patescibacteria group bacterium]